MKKILKTTKILFTIILISLLGCEKELYENTIVQNNNPANSYLLKGSQAQVVANRLKNTLQKKNMMLQDANSKLTVSNLGEINYDEIMKVVDSLGTSNYTFFVKNPDNEELNSFFNLVMQEKDGYSKVKLLEYVMSDSFKEVYKQTLNYKNFEGTIHQTILVDNSPCPEQIFNYTVGDISNPGGGVAINPTQPGTNNPSNPGGVSNPSNPSSPGGGVSNPSASLTTAIWLTDFLNCVSSGGYNYVYNNDTESWDCIANPRYFRINTGVTNPDINTESPCPDNLVIGVLVPNSIKERAYMSFSAHKDWLYNNQNTEVYGYILDYVNAGENPDYERWNTADNSISYIKEHNNSQESQQFVKECIIKIQQNPTIFTSITPFIIEKNIDDSQLDPCAKSVFQQIKNTTNNDFAKVLAKLGADNSVYNTTVKTEYHYNSNGQLINPPAHTVRTSAYNYSIYVSPDYNDKTKLHIASFLLHEMVHAYFFSLIDDCYLQNNCALLETFPQLWDYYVNHCNSQYPSDPVSHHNQIANSYVSAIASALQEYQPGLPQQVYEDLAWAGLEETTIFNTLHPVGSSSRQRILNRKAAEQTGHPVAQGTPQEQINYGQPCN